MEISSRMPAAFVPTQLLSPELLAKKRFSGNLCKKHAQILFSCEETGREKLLRKIVARKCQKIKKSCEKRLKNIYLHASRDVDEAQDKNSSKMAKIILRKSEN